MADGEPIPFQALDIWESCAIQLRPDARRTVLRPFSVEYPMGYSAGEGSRIRSIVDRFLAMDQSWVDTLRERLPELVEDRHRHSHKVLLRRFEELRDFMPAAAEIDDDRKLLLGAYFTEEYSFEAVALFNPSIVVHWDQSGLEPGAIRFVMSLRGIGEGHISSVTFRTGVWFADGRVAIDPPSSYAASPAIEPIVPRSDDACLCLQFESACDPSELVLFPITPSQKQGIEDLRLVLFTEDDGATRYIGTYTAFSGNSIREEMLTTEDFRRFTMRPVTGKVAQNKGMALFPRRIDGRYAMLGRQDNENIWLMYSDDLHRWDTAERILMPYYPWEFIQMGNCGSPIEIDEGWLVITHGVGVMRNYTIGACLLDKADPARVLGRTKWPLLRPDAETRDGYVPNVVYSCGALVHGRRLLLPYGVADSVTDIASTTVDRILDLFD